MNARAKLIERMDRFFKNRSAGTFPQNGSDCFRPSITISRQCGAGVDRIQEGLIQHLECVDDSTDLGWALFNQSLVGTVIGNHVLSERGNAFCVEKSKFAPAATIREHLSMDPSEWTLFNHTADTIRKICRMGNTIVVGRAGNFVTSDLPNTFHLRLVASEPRRVEHIAKRFNLSEGEAKTHIRESDKARASYVKRYTGSDIDDPNCYHLILNTDHWKDDVLVRVVGDTVLEWAGENSLGSDHIDSHAPLSHAI